MLNDQLDSTSWLAIEQCLQFAIEEQSTKRADAIAFGPVMFSMHIDGQRHRLANIFDPAHQMISEVSRVDLPAINLVRPKEQLVIYYALRPVFMGTHHCSRAVL